MRQLLTSLAELAGAIMVTVGGFHVDPAVGFVTGGFMLIVGGALAGRG